MKKDKTAKIAIEFYKKLGSKGMASLTNKERDKSILEFILKYIKKEDSVLDLACGYGRITFALKNRGYNVRGIDISPNLIRDAKEKAKKYRLDIEFKVGDMRNLPYPSEEFNKVICLWSSFNHILNKKDQIKTINEIYRVLKGKGIAIIDLPNGETKWAKQNIKKYGRIVPDMINGLKVYNYLHDRNTLKEICEKSNFKKYKIGFARTGGRKRIVVFLLK